MNKIKTYNSKHFKWIGKVGRIGYTYMVEVNKNQNEFMPAGPAGSVYNGTAFTHSFKIPQSQDINMFFKVVSERTGCEMLFIYDDKATKALNNDCENVFVSECGEYRIVITTDDDTNI
jgi:hypothetical protein